LGYNDNLIRNQYHFTDINQNPSKRKRKTRWGWGRVITSYNRVETRNNEQTNINISPLNDKKATEKLKTRLDASVM